MDYPSPPPLHAHRGRSPYALDLRGHAPGLYFYTLVADGVPVQTQRLLVQ